MESLKNNKQTIITPSYRVNSLIEIKTSINFEYIDQWIIVYDGNKIEANPCIFQGNNKIKEYVFERKGTSGNPQKNYALNKITNPNTLLYNLDDDNVLHPNLYILLDNNIRVRDYDETYTFNQYRIKCNNINVGYIDTAMVIIPFSLCKNIKWKLDIYEADGYYIKECYDKNKDKHAYIDEDLCYNNFLQCF